MPRSVRLMQHAATLDLEDFENSEIQTSTSEAPDRPADPLTMSAADGEAQLRVIDTGTGHCRDELPHLFSVSGASMAHGGAAMRAAASGWRWCGNWWRCTAAQSLWRARLAGDNILQLQCPLGERICRMGA